jgi:hypothetical protein
MEKDKNKAMRIIGIKGDAAIRSVESAQIVYGKEAIDAVFDGEEVPDQEGSPLWPVFSTDEGAVTERCDGCFELLSECTCH